MRQVLHQILGANLTHGEVLKGARIEARLSLDDLEKMTGIRKEMISTFESGRLAISRDYAEKLGAILKIHPSEILYPNRKKARKMATQYFRARQKRK